MQCRGGPRAPIAAAPGLRDRRVSRSRCRSAARPAPPAPAPPPRAHTGRALRPRRTHAWGAWPARRAGALTAPPSARAVAGVGVVASRDVRRQPNVDPDTGVRVLALEVARQ